MRLFALLVFCCGAAFSADLLIRNIDIVDVTSGAILPRRSVLIRGGRIQSISASTRAPRGSQLVEGRGKYLIPGLWDMHVHLSRKQNQFAMFLAWGVTGVRDMGSDLAQVKRWRGGIKSGELLGPHIETCGPAVDGVPSEDAKFPVLLVRSPAEARTAYDRLEQDLNVDFVKVRSRLPRDAYFALIERARKWGLPVAGRVPYEVMVDEAITARQNSIEALSNVLLACSTEERTMLLPRAAVLEHCDSNAAMTYDDRILATFDARKADALFEKMARYACYQVPALVKLRAATYGDAGAPALALLERKFERESYIVDRMQRLNAPIMAGAGGGYDLHRELQLLVKAGLNPLQALRAATITPAVYLEADESLGTIAAGKIADLVLLNADPLKDIANTQKISAVVLGGKYLSRAKLDAMRRSAGT